VHSCEGSLVEAPLDRGCLDAYKCKAFELLRQIRARVDLPLALHGGSGVTEDQFRTAIANGIGKINVATDLFVTTGRRLCEAARAEGASYFALSQAAIESFQERCGYYLDLFGASGRASSGSL